MIKVNKIELMPIGARLVGIFNGQWGDNVLDHGNYDKSVTFQAKGIEVHDDIITLKNFYTSPRKGYGAELSLNRGMWVMFEAEGDK